ncbi:transmembrane protein 18 isoform X2 [Nasonia vitripennis]|uniref:Transmembrane protein 18 n=1 Tax=Nasonia vitripennis TaxID=7425 RepID=A0A7M7QEM4_NASVI|nr:transmembrane protein 18 isoform X2 [Nasonia vitripennis]
MSDRQFVATDTIDGVWPFLQSIDWRDPWLALLLTFHIAVTMTALMTRNHANFQILLFLVLLLLVYFSESINEVAATNWMVFSRQQYFDSKGLFISIVFSVPILMNCMIMVASWLYQSSQLMTSLKRAQLRQQAKNRLTTTPTTDASNGTNNISSRTEKKKD